LILLKKGGNAVDAAIATSYLYDSFGTYLQME